MLEKKHGIYYTPSTLADILAKLSIKNSTATILDPCFGTGALLKAAYVRLQILGRPNPSKQLYGYDITTCHQDEEIFKSLKIPKDNIKINDFFTQHLKESNVRFDAVLINPPFIRHHEIPKQSREFIRSIVESELGININIPDTSDLWYYFILHTFQSIKESGTLAAILPWSFLHADFAKSLRHILMQKFGNIMILIFGNQLFDETDERVLFLIGNNYGEITTKFKISYLSNKMDSRIRWKKMTRKLWISSPWQSLGNVHTIKLVARIQNEIGFQPLGQLSKIKIGIVTGANKFFIISKQRAKELAFPSEILKPIIKNSRELITLDAPKFEDIKHYLLAIPINYHHSNRIQKYIETGEILKLNDRSHMLRRKKWFSINIPAIPDGFLRYMTKEIPFISLNPSHMLNINNIHGLYFNQDITEDMKRWLRISILSTISQLSIELIGRTYGGGVLKLEPREASNIPIYIGNETPMSSDFEAKINKYLLDGKKEDAMLEVNNLFINLFDISETNMELLVTSFKDLRKKRLGPAL